MSEPQLVQQLLAQRSSILAYVWTIVHDGQLAEDVYQEVAIAAVENREKMRDAKALPAWLRETARRMALATLRKSQRQPVFQDSLLDLLDEQWRQRDQQGTQDLTRHLKECLPKLGSQARRVITLRYMEGLSGIEVARSIGREVNTVYVMLSRSHKTLRDCIRQSMAQENHA